MTSLNLVLNLVLDHAFAARLERRAARAGIAPSALATNAIEAYLAHDGESDRIDFRALRRPARLVWLGRYGNEKAQSERGDALLAEGLGE